MRIYWVLREHAAGGEYAQDLLGTNAGLGVTSQDRGTSHAASQLISCRSQSARCCQGGRIVSGKSVIRFAPQARRRTFFLLAPVSQGGELFESKSIERHQWQT